MTTTAAIEVVNVRCRYGTRTVLHDVDLRVDHGEILGLLGPNGCGKSTLLKAIAGVKGIDRGAISLDGDPLGQLDRRDVATRLAVVPQEPRFSFPFSVLEVVLMGRHPHLTGLAFESNQDIDLAMDCLGRCGAANLAGRSIQSLSSGERQRVVFARALAQEPSILLLDEPASFLDIRHQVAVYDLVAELASEGCAVLTVLHDLNLAAEYCDRIALLADGRIAADGPVDEVMTYANLTRVFETEIYVDRNDLSGKPLLAPMRGSVARKVRSAAIGADTPSSGSGDD